MPNELKKLFVSPQSSIKSALKQMDQTGKKILIVVDPEERLLGTLTDGDMRRHIIKDGSIIGKVSHCFNLNSKSIGEKESKEKARRVMIKNKIEAIPVLDNKNRVVGLLTWDGLFNGKKNAQKLLDFPVVIMAGGKGERLSPITKVLPKPLIPVGEKPILELIMDRFGEFGITDFYLTVNYKGEMIKSYFDNVDISYQLHYIWEKDFLGTAGSLKLLPKKFPETFIVSNCDILVDANYKEVIDYHQKNNNALTMVGAIHHHIVPYGVIEFTKNGAVEGITEKPEYDYAINTGVYVLQKKVIKHIPSQGLFHITDLINALLAKSEKIGIYPVSEKAYMDIGQWEEYRKNLGRFFHKESDMDL